MINELVQRFKIHLEEDEKSAKTVESYVGDTSVFVAFFEEKGVDFNGEMKRFYIASYRNYLIEQQYELLTINKKVNSTHSFNRYLVDNGCTKDIVVDIAKDKVKLTYGTPRFIENGFLAATNGHVVSEFRYGKYLKLYYGAELNEITKGGQEILRAVYDKGLGKLR